MNKSSGVPCESKDSLSCAAPQRMAPSIPLHSRNVSNAGLHTPKAVQNLPDQKRINTSHDSSDSENEDFVTVSDICLSEKRSSNTLHTGSTLNKSQRHIPSMSTDALYGPTTTPPLRPATLVSACSQGNNLKEAPNRPAPVLLQPSSTTVTVETPQNQNALSFPHRDPPTRPIQSVSVSISSHHETKTSTKEEELRRIIAEREALENKALLEKEANQRAMAAKKHTQFTVPMTQAQIHAHTQSQQTQTQTQLQTQTQPQTQAQAHSQSQTQCSSSVPDESDVFFSSPDSAVNSTSDGPLPLITEDLLLKSGIENIDDMVRMLLIQTPQEDLEYSTERRPSAPPSPMKKNPLQSPRAETSRQTSTQASTPLFSTALPPLLSEGDEDTFGTASDSHYTSDLHYTKTPLASPPEPSPSDEENALMADWSIEYDANEADDGIVVGGESSAYQSPLPRDGGYYGGVYQPTAPAVPVVAHQANPSRGNSRPVNPSLPAPPPVAEVCFKKLNPVKADAQSISLIARKQSFINAPAPPPCPSPRSTTTPMTNTTTFPQSQSPGSSSSSISSNPPPPRKSTVSFSASQGQGQVREHGFSDHPPM